MAKNVTILVFGDGNVSNIRIMIDHCNYGTKIFEKFPIIAWIPWSHMNSYKPEIDQFSVDFHVLFYICKSHNYEWKSRIIPKKTCIIIRKNVLQPGTVYISVYFVWINSFSTRKTLYFIINCQHTKMLIIN